MLSHIYQLIMRVLLVNLLFIALKYGATEVMGKDQVVKSATVLQCLFGDATNTETNSIQLLEQNATKVNLTMNGMREKEDTLETNKSTVKLTVFYEALCPYSIRFFNLQLAPIYSQLRDYITLDLVPYGNAEQTFSEGHWTFICQHGTLECQYNKLHACAISLLKKDARAFKLVSCLMKDKNEAQNLQKCAESSKVDLTTLSECSQSSTADDLLAKLGTRTHDCRPPLQGVPSVAYNDVFRYEDQDESLTNLGKVVCSHLNPTPTACKDY